MPIVLLKLYKVQGCVFGHPVPCFDSRKSTKVSEVVTFFTCQWEKMWYYHFERLLLCLSRAAGFFYPVRYDILNRPEDSYVPD